MTKTHWRLILTLVPAALLSTIADAGTPTFEERVSAREAVERVYYRHQIAASEPFEIATPRDVLERKVAETLAKSVALERFWSTPLTTAMLSAEAERMTRSTRMPERLAEIRAALGGDEALFREVVARESLVNRLFEHFASFDERVHGAEKARAERLLEDLVAGAHSRGGTPEPDAVFEVTLSVPDERPGTDLEASAIEVRDLPAEGRWSRVGDHSVHRVALAPDPFRRLRATAPREPGVPGEILEERHRFTIRLLREEGEGHFTLEAWYIPKIHAETWWRTSAPAILGDDDLLRFARGLEATGATDVPSESPTGSAVDLQGSTSRHASPAGLGTDSCAPDDTWQNASLDGLPDRRAEHTAVWTGSRMIVFGGMDAFEGNELNTGGLYDPATDSWTALPLDGAPSARKGHSAIWTGSRMIVWGGGGEFFTPSVASGYSFDPIANAWTPISQVGQPSSRKYHSAVWTGTRMIVWGGDAYANPTVNTGGTYDPISDTWGAITVTGAPEGRSRHTAVWTGSTMIVWGGDAAGFATSNTGGRYDPASDSWSATSIGANVPAPRRHHTAVWTGSTMVVWGGTDGTSRFNTGGRYNPTTDSWQTTSTTSVPPARESHTAVWSGSRMIVWAGRAANPLNSGGRYDPVADTWQSTSTTNAPRARLLHTAVWTGTRMIVWGGDAINEHLNSGGRYDPSTDSWTATAMSGGLEPRREASAVWTGSLVLVWGGFDGSYSSDGARYDPALDTWSAMAAPFPPLPLSGRTGHSAIWTGSRMVIWGGNAAQADGGRYDPVANAWQGVSSTGAPVGRGYHATVWTGSKMVVWGGIRNGNYLATGGRYDPVTDVWQTLSTVGGPSARAYHTGVWTGSRMIVWGGRDTAVYHGDGGSYDPSADTWSAISGTGAPVGRMDHTAVWTGTRMIVWGGNDASYYYGTGGVYDPAADSWSATDIGTNPGPRRWHSAVWTGRTMIVWGGDSNGPLDSGGRYDPAIDSWTLTAATGAARARYLHASAWTGTHLFVWGGEATDWVQVYLNSGGYYSGIGPTVSYQDADGDLRGDPNVSSTSCTGQIPAGFVLDGTDCNDLDAGAYALPSEVTGLIMDADRITISWNSAVPGAGAGTVHDVAFGDLSDLPVGSVSDACVIDDTSVSSATHDSQPPPGVGYWYIVRGDNSCGTGTYGTTSSGVPRSTSVCP